MANPRHYPDILIVYLAKHRERLTDTEEVQYDMLMVSMAGDMKNAKRENILWAICRGRGILTDSTCYREIRTRRRGIFYLFITVIRLKISITFIFFIYLLVIIYLSISNGHISLAPSIRCCSLHSWSLSGGGSICGSRASKTGASSE